MKTKVKNSAPVKAAAKQAVAPKAGSPKGPLAPTPKAFARQTNALMTGDTDRMVALTNLGVSLAHVLVGPLPEGYVIADYQKQADKVRRVLLEWLQ